MKWEIKFHQEFQPEYDSLPEEVQDELLAEAEFVEMYGPATARPHVDTLKGSSYSNMKELRFEAANGEWRAAFAFDPKRQAVVLVAADKTGVSESRFYKRLIDKADARFARHLVQLKAEEKAHEKADEAGSDKSRKKGKKR